MYFYVCFIKWQSFAIETGSTEVFLYLTSTEDPVRMTYAITFFSPVAKMLYSSL